MKKAVLLSSLMMCFFLISCSSSHDPETHRDKKNRNTVKSMSMYRSFSNATEAQITAALDEANQLIKDMGYPNSGYSFWKTQQENEQGFTYLLQGSWPSQAAYASIHTSEPFKVFAAKYEPLFERETGDYEYFRFERVE